MYRTNKKPEEKYSVIDVLKASVAVNNFNKGYIKDDVKLPEDNFQVSKIRNRNLVLALLGENRLNSYGEQWEKKLINLTVTDKDIKTADDIVNHYEGKLFSAMGGKLDQYSESIWKVIGKEKCSIMEIGLIASIPSAYLRDVKKESIEDRVLSECKDEYIGSVKDKVEGSVELLSSVYSRNYDSYIYSGIFNEKFLVTFWNGKKIADKGETVNIKAKIKRLTESRFYPNAWETQLNYVKRTDGKLEE